MGKIFATLDPFFEPGEIMGRSVANEGFMRALLSRDPFEAYHFFVPGGQIVARLARRLEQDFPSLAARGAFLVRERAELFQALDDTDYHCFHLSDCINNPAWLAAARNRAGRETFPVTSVTHSLSYARYGQAFLAHLWPGTTSRDCVVGTSRAAMEAVRTYYEALRQGYGLHPERFHEPAVEQIPLGVDVGSMPLPDEAERAKARQALGADEKESVLLVFGRLSHHSKMDPLCLFRAAQRLFAMGVDPAGVRLALGGFGDQGERMLGVARELAANLGLKLTVRVSPDEAAKRELFAAADVFVSPVDNPQETFGLSVVEAGACGLPVVASDYDGYRDTVEHGVTGFLVPVAGLSSTAEVDAQALLVFDTATHLRLAQRTAVDVAAMAEALATLVKDENLRRTMGLAARRRVEERFAWDAVIERYLALWDDLWSRPVDRQAAAQWRHPLTPDYARVFAAHPSTILSGDETIKATKAGNAVYRGRDSVLIYEGLGREIAEDTVRRLLFETRKPKTAREVCAALAHASGLSGEECGSLAVWALKHDLIEVVEEGAR